MRFGISMVLILVIDFILAPMQKFIFSVISLLYAFTSIGQGDTSTVLPTYTEGEKAIYGHLGQKVRNLAKEKNIRNAEVYLAIHLSKFGAIDSIETVHNPKKLNVSKLKPVIEELADWNPGIINGTPQSSVIGMCFGFYTGEEYAGYRGKVDSTLFKRFENNVLRIMEMYTVTSYKMGLGSTSPSLYLSGSAGPSHEERYKTAVTHLDNEEYESAEKLLSELYRGDPSNGRTVYLRGLCKYKQGNQKGACKDWVKATKLGSKQSQEMLNQFCN